MRTRSLEVHVSAAMTGKPRALILEGQPAVGSALRGAYSPTTGAGVQRPTPRAKPAPLGHAIRWYDLLTLDHTVCRICFAWETRPATVSAEESRRPLLDKAVYAELLKRPRNQRLAVLQARRKAAFRRHITAVHPDWTGRVRWVRY